MAGVAALMTLLVMSASPIGAASEYETVLNPVVHTSAAGPSEQLDDAQRLFDDVNAARMAHGLPPLSSSPRLDAFAREVARQMAVRNYFGHTDPDGVTFDERIRASRIAYHIAAENMAFDQTESHANAMLMHSPGHYANIMDPTVRRLGVSVVAAGPDGVFYVEEFTN